MYNCIPEEYLLPEDQITKAKEIVSWIGYYKQMGRPPVDAELDRIVVSIINHL